MTFDPTKALRLAEECGDADIASQLRAACEEAERLKRCLAEEERHSVARLQAQIDIATERDRLKSEVERLKTRQQELLATIVRVTNETPFADEAKDALAQRGKLVAEIGTLRSLARRALDLVEMHAAARLEVMQGVAHETDEAKAICNGDLDWVANVRPAVSP